MNEWVTYHLGPAPDFNIEFMGRKIGKEAEMQKREKHPCEVRNKQKGLEL